jgi:excinuclease ABC subunit A
MTEINDYLKILWPRIARAFCPSCDREIRPETAQSIAEQVFCHFEGWGGSPNRPRAIEVNRPYLGPDNGKIVLITFWVAVPSKTEPRKFFDFLQQQGYLRVWMDNKVVRVDDPNPKTKRLGARVQVVQDRIATTGENRTRLVEAIETALRFGKGQVNVIPVEAGVSRVTSKTAADTAATTVLPFSTGWHCA